MSLSGISPLAQLTETTYSGLGIEVHVFDLERDLYGKRMDVEFVSKIRDEKKFDNLEELKSQISLDVEEAKKILEK